MTKTFTSSILSLSIIIPMDARNIFTADGAGAIYFMVMMLFGFGAVLTAYVFSFAAKSTPAAFTAFILFALMCGKTILLCFINKFNAIY